MGTWSESLEFLVRFSSIWAILCSTSNIKPSIYHVIHYSPIYLRLKILKRLKSIICFVEFYFLRKENEVLQTETQMFEKYLKRNEPKDTLGLPSAGLSSGVAQSGSQQDVGRGVGRKRSKSRTSNINTSLRLTTEQKCDIAQKEIDDLKDEIEQLKENCEKVLDTYKVYIYALCSIFVFNLFYVPLELCQT